MNRSIITAKVKELNKPNWIELYADNTYIGQIYGEATLQPETIVGRQKYMLCINSADGYFDAFIHIDTIERVEPIKQEVVSVSS